MVLNFVFHATSTVVDDKEETASAAVQASVGGSSGSEVSVTRNKKGGRETALLIKDTLLRCSK